MAKLKAYKNDLKISLSYGVYPTLELLKHHPKNVFKVIIHSRAEKNKGTIEIKKYCQQFQIPTEINDKFIFNLVKKENCHAVGMFNKYTSTLDNKSNHLLLVSPSDMGNLGTIIRTMVGFNINNLALIKPAADLFNPKVIRSSMGAIFQINFHYYNNFDEYKSLFKDYNLYSFVTKAEKSLEQTEINSPFTLIFGSEGGGLPQEYSKISQSTYIPYNRKIDSLNLSVAIGIALSKVYLLQM